MDIFFLVFQVLGGLALFIFGMNIMTDGLRRAAGAGLRTILGNTTRNRFAGLGFGTVLGTLVHSSATTVMLVGFVNAGLMTLEQTIAPILGANIGTTISMQAISFKLGAYCFTAIAIGFIMNMGSPHQKIKLFGRALMGFGLLFLGMNIMSEAIKPHREALAPLLTSINGTPLTGTILGVLISLSLTAIWQSSGATIAICFALSEAGVFTSLEQVFPIVLGAHIGTCATALLGSIGTGIEARRTAFAHLYFNISNVIVSIIAKPLLLYLVMLTSSDLNHQIANLHTMVMVTASAIVLPFCHPYARLVRKLVPSKQAVAEPSHLDDKLLKYPEQAIAAAIRELQRITKICRQSLHLDARMILFDYNRKTIKQIKLNEEIINEIKKAMKAYLNTLSSRYLSRRQTLLAAHINRCIADIERIGDHIDEICDISVRRKKAKNAVVDKESFDWLFDLLQSAIQVIDQVVQSLEPEHDNFREMAKKVLLMRDEYAQKSVDIKSNFAEKVSEHHVTPTAVIYYTAYIAAMDRVVRHAKTIALAEKQPEFWIKQKKWEKHAKDLPVNDSHELVDPEEYLKKLHMDDSTF